MLHTVLLVLAFALFFLAAFNVKIPRLNLVALGFAAWIATFLF